MASVCEPVQSPIDSADPAEGLLPLAQLPLLRLLGGSQFRKFCVVAMLILVITVVTTCMTQEEKERQEDFRTRK